MTDNPIATLNIPRRIIGLEKLALLFVKFRFAIKSSKFNFHDFWQIYENAMKESIQFKKHSNMIKKVKPIQKFIILPNYSQTQKGIW